MNNERLFDLVRYCRAELHQDGLITDQEYADLVTGGGGSDSARRLEVYDAMRNRLAEIDAGANADAADLEEMRDGTKMTRAGLVEIIVYQRQDMRETAAAIREAIAMCDEAYEATGYIKVAKSSHQRIRLEKVASQLEFAAGPTASVPHADATTTPSP